jgi:hypothetical protein
MGGSAASGGGGSGTAGSGGAQGGGGGDACSGVTCMALDTCHLAGACDPSTGLCSNPPVADGTPCDDGTGCSQNDRCQGGVCRNGDTVDQSSYAVNGFVNLTPADAIGQTFVVARDGQLMGIELRLLKCTTQPPVGALRLDLYDTAGVLSASAAVATSTIVTGDCIHTDWTLDPCVVGSGFFDLSSAGLPVSVGDVLSFVVSQDGVPPGQCDLGGQQCISGELGAPCNVDWQCNQIYAASYSNPGQYAAGQMTVDGVGSNGDFTFKTFVQ